MTDMPNVVIDGRAVNWIESAGRKPPSRDDQAEWLINMMCGGDLDAFVQMVLSTPGIEQVGSAASA